jgi:hypothetical protein
MIKLENDYTTLERKIKPTRYERDTCPWVYDTWTCNRFKHENRSNLSGVVTTVSHFSSPRTVTTWRYSWLYLWWTRRIAWIQGSIGALLPFTTWQLTLSNKLYSTHDDRKMFQQSSDYISWSITTHGQMRRLPHQSARHSTADHGDASDGVFLLLLLWVLPSWWAILLRRSPSSLSLACWWPLGANGSLFCEWRCL